MNARAATGVLVMVFSWLGLGANDLTPAALAQTPALTPVRYTTIPSFTTSIVVNMAKAQGLFVKHGLDVEIVNIDSTPAGLAAISSGAAQFTFTGANIPDAVVAGIPAVAVFAHANVPLGQVCARAAIKTPNDLIGKTAVLNNRGSSPDVTFRAWLAAQRVNAEQMTLRNIDAGATAILAVVAAGQADVFVLNPPKCDQHAAQGFHLLSNVGAGGTKFFNAGVAVSRDYLAANRPIVRNFVAALVESRKLFQDNRAVALASIKAVEQLTDDALAEATWTFFRSHLAIPSLIEEAAMLEAAKVSANQRTREQGPAMVSRMYDNSVLQEVLGR